MDSLEEGSLPSAGDTSSVAEWETRCGRPEMLVTSIETDGDNPMARVSGVSRSFVFRSAPCNDEGITSSTENRIPSMTIRATPGIALVSSVPPIADSLIVDVTGRLGGLLEFFCRTFPQCHVLRPG